MGTKIKFLLLSVLMSNILHSQSNENVNILKKYALHKCLMNNYYKVDSLFISHDYTPSYLFQVKSIDYDLLDKINVYSEKNTSNYYRNGVQENLEETREIIFNQQIKNDTMEYFNENTYKDWEIDNNYSAPYPEMEKFLKRGNEKARITKDDAKIYVTISNTLNPYEQILVYSPKTKICIASYKEFYKNIIGFLTEYNEIGKLIKEIDYDKPYKFSIEDLIKKMKDDYKVDLLDVKHVISLYRYEEKKELNIPLYEIWYNYDDLNRNNVECYLINGTTGETLFTIKRFLGDKKGSLLQNYLDSLKNKQKTTSAIYKTHQGKSYTQAEWEAYEEKQYEEYCKRTGRPYTPKNQLTNPSDRDARKSFIANDFETGDKNIPKKKKGFWG